MPYPTAAVTEVINPAESTDQADVTEQDEASSGPPPAKKANTSVLYHCYESGQSQSCTVYTSICNYLEAVKRRRQGFKQQQQNEGLVPT
jgi:hypothetical protein